MPYVIRKLPNKDLYRVYNKDTKNIKAKGTTLEKAEKMVRLLNAIKHGWKPAAKNRTRKPQFWPRNVEWPLPRGVRIAMKLETFPPVYVLSNGIRVRGEKRHA